jgi:hypothetical protein
LSSVKVRGEDCISRCAATPGCTHFTWDNRVNGMCWMKYGAIAQKDALYSNWDGIFCGIMLDPKPMQYGKIKIISIQHSSILNKKVTLYFHFYLFFAFFLDWKDGDKWIWSYKCAFEGKNLTSVQVRADNCSVKCASTAGCTHFTWDNYMDGTCWMKHGAIAQKDAIYSNSPGILCGITFDPKPMQYGKIHIISI